MFDLKGLIRWIIFKMIYLLGRNRKVDIKLIDLLQISLAKLTILRFFNTKNRYQKIEPFDIWKIL